MRLLELPALLPHDFFAYALVFARHKRNFPSLSLLVVCR
jgi:hypothetical protein